MIRRVHPSWLVPLLLAAIALLAPSTAAASSTPQPSTPRVAAAPCTGALSANTEITNVSAVAPTRIDALANDCLGAAGPTRPLTIVSVGQGTYGSATTDGATITYDPRACATGDAGGNDFLAYTISDGVNTKPGIAVVHIARPGADPLTGAFNPLTDAPQAAFVTNSTIGSTVPLRLSWCGVAAGGAGVKAYRIEQGTNGGATFPTVVSAGTTATASTRTVTPGASFAWRVRTTDTKGRTGAFAASLPSKVTVIQDTITSIVRYSSGWSTASGSKYSGGKEHVTSKAGATATLTVTNVRAVAVVASKATKRGSFTVYVDGVKVTPSAIGEKASTAAWRRVLYVRGLTSGAGVSHVVTFKAAGNGRVDLDAFLTLSGKLDQSLTFSAPPSAQYHGPAYPVAATASSGLPVSVSINQASWTVCTLSGGAISFLRPGSCRIDASQPGDPTWNARAASQILAVAPIPLTVSGITAADRPYDGTTTATLGTNGAALAGKVAGDVVGLDATNATGAFADRHVGTGKAVQVSGLALTGADASKYVLIQPTASAAITPRGLTVSFTAQTRPWDGTTAASIVGCTVATKLGGDDVTCDAGGASASFADSDAGTAKTVTGSGFALAGADASDYAIDAVNSAAADIAKAGQTIAFTSTPTDPSILTDTYTPTATATSGLGVDFTIDPSAAGVCHIDAGMVSMDGAGTCIVAANQDGDANHEAADEVTQTFTVDLLPQTIAFDLSGVSVAYGDAPVTIGATASSGLTVAFASQTPGVCTVAGTDVTVLTTGTCTIRASQPGNGTYAAAPDVDQSFTVARRAITVTAVADTKPADGTTASAGVPTITAGTLAAGDTGTWTQTFNTAAVGTGKTLTPAGTVAHGGTEVTARYLITFVAVTTGVITPGAADVTTSTVAVSPGSVKADGVDTATVTVHLYDRLGNSLVTSGGTVTVFADHGSVGAVTDNANGTYTAIYTSDTVKGKVTVSAKLNGTAIVQTVQLNQH